MGTVLLYTAAVLFLSGAILLFAPLHAFVHAEGFDGRADGRIAVSFLHPLFLLLKFDSATKKILIRILGKSFNLKKSADPLPDSDKPQKKRPVARPPTSHLPKTGADIKPPEFADTVSEDIVSQPITGSYKEKAVSLHRNTDKLPPVDENMASDRGKKDNWYTALRNNRYLFFIGNRRWRTKVLRWLLRWMNTLLRMVRFDRFELALRGGLRDDPALTATLCGMHRALVHGLRMKKPYAITFEPVFTGVPGGFSAGLRVSTSLAALLAPAVTAIFTFPLIHTLYLVLRLYLRERKTRRKSTRNFA